MYPRTVPAALSHLDEGYSEGNPSESPSDADASDTSMNISTRDPYLGDLLSAVLALPVEQRRELAYAISKTLPVSHIAYNKSRLDHLLYFDPVAKLPTELFYLVLAHLSPRDLLDASLVSKSWREKTRDERLWRLCFANQGWVLNPERQNTIEAKLATEMSHEQSGTGIERRHSRKRGRAEAFEDTAGDATASLPSAGVSDRPQNRDVSISDDGADGNSFEDGMEGIEISATRSPNGTVHVQSHETTGLGRQSLAPRERSGSVGTDSAVEDLNSEDLQVQPAMFQNGGHTPKFSWPWLYKHRRRLEDNWEKGVYQMFSLPHPQHRNEGHDECVYTIQHSGRHLVSGSRDKTIRRWDLETQRLIGAPLRGHNASVLCLQFDDRPDQDIIVSGGSDSWVIIWQFSTGKMLHKLTDAHSESVLNLRFDDRYIVTCSKDKSIKIWNRHSIRRDDPIIPQYVLPAFNKPTNQNADDMIKEFSLLCTLTGHHAAVNAVQIQNDIVVSASGDRTIKAWDIHTGQSVKNFLGHTKGIACVQFDGRRVVSGSSDNTVRIFDADKAVEVACLEGHSNLVRTVQARFGDMDLTTDEELSEQAQKADRAMIKHMMQGGKLGASGRRRQRNAGSSRPQDMMSVGAKIPPGGGGSKWARIVSGSYDERVIIWTKDKLGNWRPLHSLSQTHLLQHSARRGPRPLLPPHITGLGQQAPAQNLQTQQSSLPGSHLLAQARQHLHHASALIATQQIQHARNSSSPGQTIPSTGNEGESSARGENSQPVGTDGQTNATGQGGMGHEYAAAAETLRRTNNDLASQMQLVAQQQQQQQPQQQSPPQSSHSLHHHRLHRQMGQTQATTLTHQQLHAPTPTPTPTPAAGGQNTANNLAAQTARPTNLESRRVFKLQFDARRIICCSQNKVIVGWDFANGDPDLEIVGDLSTETP